MAFATRQYAFSQDSWLEVALAPAQATGIFLVKNGAFQVSSLTLAHQVSRNYAHSYIFDGEQGAEASVTASRVLHSKIVEGARRGVVDLFVFGHSNRTVDFVRQFQPWVRRKIRLAYNAGCGDSRQSEQWLELGVGATVGHGGVSSSPLFLRHFLPKWTSGHILEDAVTYANRQLEESKVTFSAIALGHRIGISTGATESNTVPTAKMELHNTRGILAGNPKISIDSRSWKRATQEVPFDFSSEEPLLGFYDPSSLVPRCLRISSSSEINAAQGDLACISLDTATDLDILANPQLRGVAFSSVQVDPEKPLVTMRNPSLPPLILADTIILGEDSFSLDLSHSDLRGTQFLRTYFGVIKLQVNEADWSGAKFEGFYSIEGQFNQWKANGTKFRKSALSKKKVTASSLRDTSWEEVELDDSLVQDSDFSGSTWKSVRMRRIQFERTSFERSRWEDCTLETALFQGSDLRSADLSRCTFLSMSCDAFKNAKFDAATRLPKEFQHCLD